MRSLRILVSAYACVPGTGSEPGFGWGWANALAELGHDVVVLTTPEGRDAIGEVLPRADRPSPRFEYVDVPSLYEPLLRGTGGVYLRYLLWQRAALHRARSLHKVEPFEIVHHVTWGSLTWGTPLWRLGVPTVFGPAGGGQVADPRLRAFFGRSWHAERTRSRLASVQHLFPGLRGTVKHCYVLCTNSATLRLVQRAGGRDASLFLDTGVNDGGVVEASTSKRSDSVKDIVWLGRIMPRKGLVLALRAFDEVSYGPCRLIVVGDGPGRAEAEDFARSMRRNSDVVFGGMHTWTQVQEILRGANLLFFSSLRDSFGSQILEAFQAGVPVVALRQHGVADFLREPAAVLVEVSPASELVVRLARVLDAMLSDETGREARSRAAREFAAMHTWLGHAVAATRIYECLSAQHGG